MRKIGLLIIALAATGFAPAAAQPNNGDPPAAPTPAPPLPVDGTWTLFCWTMGVGSLNVEGAFTLTGPATLDVTDAFIDGDQFDVLDNNVSIGMTSTPTDTGAFQGDPDAAFADPDWSSGTFSLGSGGHSITIRLTAAATGFNDGCGYLRAMPAVPATPAWALAALVVALSAAGYSLLRRRAGI